MQIHLAQISYRPAYFEKGLDYLAEPHVGVGASTPLGFLSPITSVAEFLQDSKATYVAHIAQKLVSIAEWSALRGADLLVFPEYSVPIECLPSLRDIASKYRTLIAAGSHRVKVSSQCDEVYRALSVAPPIPGTAVCPLLLPNGTVVFAPKLSKSKWEPSLITDASNAPVKIEAELHGDQVTIGVLLCIDSLLLPLAGRLLDTPKPHVVICPSFSPTVDPFKDFGALASLSEVLFCYANEASAGESFFNLPQQWGPLLQRGGLDTSSVPSRCEAVLELVINPDQFFQKKGTLSSSPGVSTPSAFQIVYDAEFAEYAALKQLRLDLNAWIIEHNDPSTGIDWLDSFLTEYGQTLPPVLQQNLRNLRHRILPFYDGDARPLADATEVVNVKTGSGTLGVFARSTQRAIRILTDYVRGENSQQIDAVFDCLKGLKRYQQELPLILGEDELRVSSEVIEKPVLPSIDHRPAQVVDVSHFQNRGQELDLLRGFFGDHETRVIIITGSSGIGKSDLATVVFPKQLVDWQPIRILIPQGARVPRLISEIAYRLGLSFDVDALSSASHQVFRGKVRKLLQRFFEKPRRALVIDDLRQILRDATARDVRHLSTFIEEASTADAVVGGKILLLSSQWLKQEWLNRKGVKHVQLRRIQDLYVTRILEFSLRRSGVISGEAVPEPPQDLLDVISFCRETHESGVIVGSIIGSRSSRQARLCCRKA